MTQENSWWWSERPSLASCSCSCTLLSFLFVYSFISVFLPQTTETGEDEEDQPLSLAWPSNPRKQVTFLIVFPIVFPLWITLPDVRKPVSRSLFSWLLVKSTVYNSMRRLLPFALRGKGGWHMNMCMLIYVSDLSGKVHNNSDGSSYLISVTNHLKT